MQAVRHILRRVFPRKKKRRRFTSSTDSSVDEETTGSVSSLIGQSPRQLISSERDLLYEGILRQHGLKPLADYPPLCFVACRGHIQALRDILDAGCPPDMIRPTTGCTALYIAAEFEREEIVTLLLEHGATVDFPSRTGATALFIAVAKGHQGVTQQLLAAGADPNRRCASRNRALSGCASAEGLAGLHQGRSQQPNGRSRPHHPERAVSVDSMGGAGRSSSPDRCEFESPEPLTGPSNVDTNDADVPMPSLDSSAGPEQIVLSAQALPDASPLSEDEEDVMPRAVVSFSAPASRHTLSSVSASSLPCTFAALSTTTTPVLQASSSSTVVGYPPSRSKADRLAAGRSPQHHLLSSSNESSSSISPTSPPGPLVHGCCISPLADVATAAGQSDGPTPLFLASFHGHAEIVRMLINAGARVDSAASDHRLPLHTASHMGHLGVVQVLLEFGADVDAITASGVTAAFVAAQNGHVAVVSLLLDAGANADHMAESGTTPLHAASACGRHEVIALLLERGASLQSSKTNGSTPLSCAVRYGHTRCVEQLIHAGADPNTPGKASSLPLCMSSRKGYHRIVRALLEGGANPALAGPKGRTPLYMASFYGHALVVEELLRFLPDASMVNAANDNGATPLLAAAYHGHTTVIKALLGAGANPNLAAQDGRTPLYTSAFNGHVDVVKALINAGAAIDATNSNGATPLAVAAQMGRSEVVSELLRAGSNVEASTKEGATPLVIAASRGHHIVVALLIARGARTITGKWDVEERARQGCVHPSVNSTRHQNVLHVLRCFQLRQLWTPQNHLHLDVLFRLQVMGALLCNRESQYRIADDVILHTMTYLSWPPEESRLFYSEASENALIKQVGRFPRGSEASLELVASDHKKWAADPLVLLKEPL